MSSPGPCNACIARLRWSHYWRSLSAIRLTTEQRRGVVTNVGSCCCSCWWWACVADTMPHNNCIIALRCCVPDSSAHWDLSTWASSRTVFLPLLSMAKTAHVVMRNTVTMHCRTDDCKLIQTRGPTVASIADRTGCQWPSTSSSVDDFHLIWKNACHFLLLINITLALSLTVSEIWWNHL